MNKVRIQRATRWNDIRIVGPALVALLMVATILSPSFASADNSVGGGGLRCTEQMIMRSEVPDSFGIAPVGVGGDGRYLVQLSCCIDPNFVDNGPVGWSSAAAFSQLSAASIGINRREVQFAPCTPGVTFTTPDPIVGPTLIGPITGTSSDGTVTLSMPGLLPKYFDANRGMRVVSTVDGRTRTMYLGTVPADGKVSFKGGAGDYTFHASVITGAPFSEVISIADIS